MVTAVLKNRNGFEKKMAIGNGENILRFRLERRSREPGKYNSVCQPLCEIEEYDESSYKLTKVETIYHYEEI